MAPKKIYPEKKKVSPIVKEVWESKIKQKKSNKHISYSQLSQYNDCPKKWNLTYLKKLAPYDPSIHATFGTAVHETIQEWLEELYHGKVKDAMAMDLDALLYSNMIQAYKVNKAQGGHEDFSDAKEMQMFYLDGKHILDYLKKKRNAYFTTKNWHLAGVETLLYQELRPGVFFKGFIDLVFYNSITERWKIVDIKTSTRGWSASDKTDINKTSQLILYREYFAKQFNVDPSMIDIEYFVVKRRVPAEAEFASMQKRVQEFQPRAGKNNTKKAIGFMEKFVAEAVDMNGEYIQKDYPATPSKSACQWCAFGKKMRLCPDAVL